MHELITYSRISKFDPYQATSDSDRRSEIQNTLAGHRFIFCSFSTIGDVVRGPLPSTSES